MSCRVITLKNMIENLKELFQEINIKEPKKSSDLTLNKVDFTLLKNMIRLKIHTNNFSLVYSLLTELTERNYRVNGIGGDNDSIYIYLSL